MEKICMECGKGTRGWTVRYVENIESIKTFCQKCWLKLMEDVVNNKRTKPEWLHESTIIGKEKIACAANSAKRM